VLFHSLLQQHKGTKQDGKAHGLRQMTGRSLFWEITITDCHGQNFTWEKINLIAHHQCRGMGTGGGGQCCPLLVTLFPCSSLEHCCE